MRVKEEPLLNENLWNISHKKTKETWKLLESLDVPSNFDMGEESKFWNIINEAKSKYTVNDILKTIGYVNNKVKPKIFEWSMNRK